MSERPLAGLTVIEWATDVAGPYCGRLLAGFGAEVIKVEPPGGDPARGHPPFVADQPGLDRGILFLYLNQGKRCVTLDVGQPAGRALLEDLVRNAAILIEDHRPAELVALGLTPGHWAALNPSLVVTSITPYGQTGPRANDRAYHLNRFHAGGAGYLLAGSRTGVDRPPVKIGSRVGDFDAGAGALIPTLAALYWRELTGAGQQIDASAEETALGLNRVAHGRFTFDGGLENRQTHQRRPGTIFRCRDGYVEAAIGNDASFAKLCRLIGRPELAQDERFQHRFARDARSPEINAIIEEWAAHHGKDEIARWLQDEHIPGGPYHTLDEVAASAQYAHRGFFQVFDHPGVGAVPYPTVPYQFNETPWTIDRPAPTLGADNAAVFGQLGRSTADLAALRSAGVI